MSVCETIRQILELARWAPSGDNTQPWRFEVLSDQHVVVHGFDTRDHCVYDLDGHPSQIALGALIETASIAASAHGLRLHSTRRVDAPEHRPTLDWIFQPDASVTRDPLVDCVSKRSVQRRPLRTQALTPAECAALEQSVGAEFSIHWLASWSARLRMAKLLFHSAKIRLVMPEAYRVHRDIIQWGAQFSSDKVPDQALGTDPLTTRLMRFVMQSWERVSFFNRYFAGTWAPRIQLDFVPGVACAAHFILLARKPAQSTDDYLTSGRAMQRFWLTATSLDLQLQPELTPLIFSRYARNQTPFTQQPGLNQMAAKLSQRLADLLGAKTAALAVFMGRVGHGNPPKARSLRRSVQELLSQRMA